jgi:superoxide dismutase, Fe-Mn family
MFTLPVLPYDYVALEPIIDVETMHLHHDKHHALYVENLNKIIFQMQNDARLKNLTEMTIEKLIMNLNSIPDQYRTLIKNHGGGHLNHSLYWNAMGPTNKLKPINSSGRLIKSINLTFGSLNKFIELFSLKASSHFGSGWVWLVVNTNSLEIVDTNNQDNPLSDGKKPILLIDVWEHAYYLKYKNVRAEYIKNWWNVVNWESAEKLFELAMT